MHGSKSAAFAFCFLVVVQTLLAQEWTIRASSCARGGAKMICQVSNERMVMSGGGDIRLPWRPADDDTWRLGLRHRETSWQDPPPAGTPPSPRISPSAAFDSSIQDMIVSDERTDVTQCSRDVWMAALEHLYGGRSGCLNSLPYQTGWPQQLESIIWDAVSFVDVDNSGTLEVLCASVVSGSIHLKTFDGADYPNWPVHFGKYNYGAPVAGDVDGDRMMEIFLGANTGAGKAVLYGWKYDGTYMQGWPVYFPDSAQVNSSPVLSDLDSDGDLEIIFSLYMGDSTYIFNHDGSVFPGWPRASPSSARDSPVVGDLDGDGDLEIICAAAYYIYAWHHDGTECAGFPVSVASEGYTDGIAMGDLDGDNLSEIVVTTVAGLNNVLVYGCDGAILSGWPQGTGASIYGEPCLGDLDGDGDLEIVVAGTGWWIDHHVWAWHHDGMLVDGWPAVTSYDRWCQSSVAIADIDNDGDMEVIIGSDDHQVYAFHHDASLVDDWPISGPTGQVSAPISVGDIDSDGDLEIGVGALDRKIHIWDLPGTLEPANVEWETYHHDHWFTGWYHPIPPRGLSVQSQDSLVVLVWLANSEPDIVGYRIYRSTSSGYSYDKMTHIPHGDTTYLDTAVVVGTTYYYVTTACTKAGSESRFSTEASATVTSVQGVGDEHKGCFVRSDNLVRHCATITYGLPETSRVGIEIYNTLGEKLRTLLNEKKNAGVHSMTWNGTNELGETVPSGVYFVTFAADPVAGAWRFQESTKLILIK